MIFQTLGNKANRVFIAVKNNEASATLASSFPEPAAFNTLDGISVVKLATAAAKLSTGALCGVVNRSIAFGKYGIAQVYGIVTANVPVLQQTKASTDATYASLSIDAGVVLTPDTVNNAFSTAASIAASAFLPWGCIPASTSWASSSGTTGAGTLSSRALYSNVFLRMM